MSELSYEVLVSELGDFVTSENTVVLQPLRL
jgi:hypothetical protein